jgi:hypothetical protein
MFFFVWSYSPPPFGLRCGLVLGAWCLNLDSRHHSRSPQLKKKKKKEKNKKKKAVYISYFSFWYTGFWMALMRIRPHQGALCCSLSLCPFLFLNRKNEGTLLELVGW